MTSQKEKDVTENPLAENSHFPFLPCHLAIDFLVMKNPAGQVAEAAWPPSREGGFGQVAVGPAATFEPWLRAAPDLRRRLRGLGAFPQESNMTGIVARNIGVTALMVPSAYCLLTSAQPDQPLHRRRDHPRAFCWGSSLRPPGQDHGRPEPGQITVISSRSASWPWPWPIINHLPPTTHSLDVRKLDQAEGVSA